MRYEPIKNGYVYILYVCEKPHRPKARDVVCIPGGYTKKVPLQ